MSDERDSADAAADGSGTEAAAVATRPQRPSGKRSRGRATGTDPEKGAAEAADSGDSKAGVIKGGSGGKGKTARKSSEPSRNPIAFVFNYMKQVVAELRKVIWPNRKQMITYTSVVLVFLVFMVALIAVADLGLARLVLLVFG